MIGLYMATFEDPNSYYILDNKSIDRSRIKKSIEKLKDFTEDFIDIITEATHPNEDKRLTAK